MQIRFFLFQRNRNRPAAGSDIHRHHIILTGKMLIIGCQNICDQLFRFRARNQNILIHGKAIAVKPFKTKNMSERNTGKKALNTFFIEFFQLRLHFLIEFHIQIVRFFIRQLQHIQQGRLFAIAGFLHTRLSILQHGMIAAHYFSPASFAC